MKICIYGSGVIGSIIAARLVMAGGAQVSVVARGEQLRALRSDGLRFEGPDGSTSVLPLRCTDDPRQLGIQDYVIITLKGQQLEAALGGIQSLMDEQTVVIPPTTGIPHWYFTDLEGYSPTMAETFDPGLRVSAALPARQSLGAVYFFGGAMRAPGHVWQSSTNMRLPIGEPNGSVSERVRRLADVLTAAGFNSPVVPDIRSWIWIKMISSLCWNPIAVLTGATLGEIADEAPLIGLVRRMMNEADAVASAFGASDPLKPEERIAMATTARHHKMSMLQDIEQGRTPELDVLQESITKMSRIAKIAIPTIEEIYALLRMHVSTKAVVGRSVRAAPASTGALD